MRTMSNARTVRLRRSCDWLKVEKQVKRYINEGNDVYSVACGGFEVRFDDAGRNGATDSEAQPPLSSMELSVRRKLGHQLLRLVDVCGDGLYDRLNRKEAAWCEVNGGEAARLADMRAVIDAGMRALYGIELIKNEDK